MDVNVNGHFSMLVSNFNTLHTFLNLSLSVFSSPKKNLSLSLSLSFSFTVCLCAWKTHRMGIRMSGREGVREIDRWRAISHDRHGTRACTILAKVSRGIRVATLGRRARTRDANLLCPSIREPTRTPPANFFFNRATLSFISFLSSFIVLLPSLFKIVRSKDRIFLFFFSFSILHFAIIKNKDRIFVFSFVFHRSYFFSRLLGVRIKFFFFFRFPSFFSRLFGENRIFLFLFFYFFRFLSLSLLLFSIIRNKV